MCSTCVCCFSSLIAGTKRARCRPSLYRSSGGTFDVATSVTPRLNSAPNSVAQQHGIGDVRDEEFIETDQARLAGDLFGDEFERIGDVLVLLQFVVHRLHEAMKVTALLVLERQAVEEQVHQPGLAATDATPDIQPALQVRVFFPKQSLEQAIWAAARAGACADRRAPQPFSAAQRRACSPDARIRFRTAPGPMRWSSLDSQIDRIPASCAAQSLWLQPTAYSL